MPQHHVLLISTLGHRDLERDGQRLPGDRFRSACRELHEQVKADPATWDHLAFPVLSVVLDWLADRARQRLRLPDDTAARRALHLALYLVATNQTDPRFAETDTAPLAELVRGWLERQRGQYGGLAIKIWEFSGNPAAFDETLRFFRDLVMHRALPRIEPGHDVVVNATSGTPALLFGLLVGLEPALPETTQVIVVPLGAERPLPFALLPELRRLQLLRDARTALLRWEPALAATFLADAHAPPALVTFTRALAERLAFDFSAALSLVDEVIATSTGQLRQLAAQAQAELLELERAAARALAAREPVPDVYPLLLREVWQSARIVWEQERYADFLARLFRLEEGALRWAVERFLGIPTGVEYGNGGRALALSAYREALRNDVTLRTLAEQHRIDPDRPPDRHALRALLQHPTLGQEATVRELLAASNQVAALTPLRNASVVGHGFAPVSAAALAQKLGEAGTRTDPLLLLDQLARTVGLETTSLPAEPWRQGILHEIERVERAARGT
ncbi:MAG: hypothetical protein RMJ05_06125 [Thermomicrobium sp.]|nr:hypothetical protein [Thermomicrobium sp.]MDW8006278.1 hypothetical protein [Thermomicrobium sp.]